jgi:hypothetical protein
MACKKGETYLVILLRISHFLVYSISRPRSFVNFLKTIRKFLQNAPKNFTHTHKHTHTHTHANTQALKAWIWLVQNCTDFKPRGIYTSSWHALFTKGNLSVILKNVLLLHLKICYICLSDFYRYSLLLCHLKPGSEKPESIVETRKEFCSPIPLHPPYLIMP